MRKLAFLPFVVAIILLPLSASAQKKIKYKDIWALLNTRQYEAAEPFLKSYLRENTDNPNAYLYMGIVFQEKAAKGDVLRNTANTTAYMDSAIHFYTKAYQTITEKEIKKNDEYYQSYNRRDLRTGAFGVKLSDIQFDIEKRMESLRERIDRVKMVKHYFALSDSLYKKSQALYTSMVKPYEDERHFFLSADTVLLQQLLSLSVRFDSSMKAFEQFRGAVAMLGKIGYNHSLNKREIKALKQDGYSTADFYRDSVLLWDYKLWADRSRESIQKEIIPIREHLVTYDHEINKLREKIIKDSISVRNDLTKLIDRLLLEKLAKYDPTPLPMDLFALKIAELEYRSIVLENSAQKDSLNVQLKLTRARKALYHAHVVDSLAEVLVKRNIDRELRNYHRYVTSTYGDAASLKNYLRLTKDNSAREKEMNKEKVRKAEETMRWMVVNAVDSIPLFRVAGPAPFMPLHIVEEKFTVGLHYSDSVTATGYFFTITPSRVPDVMIRFPVNKPAFKQSAYPITGSLVYSDSAGQVFYVLFFWEKAGKDQKYPATLAKIYRSDGLAWATNHTLSFMPTELSYRMETGEFLIRADAAETVIDKNGKVLR